MKKEHRNITFKQGLKENNLEVILTLANFKGFKNSTNQNSLYIGQHEHPPREN